MLFAIEKEGGGKKWKVQKQKSKNSDHKIQSWSVSEETKLLVDHQLWYWNWPTYIFNDWG